MKPKWYLAAAASALLACYATDAHKRVALNIMSHHPLHAPFRQVVRELPKWMFTRGDYKGVYAQPNSHAHDMNAIYLGLEKNPFSVSPHRPTSLTGSKDQIFYDPGPELKVAITPTNFERADLSMLESIVKMKKGDVIRLPQAMYHNTQSFGNGMFVLNGWESDIGFYNYTLSIGMDDDGRYLSFYDVWDFEGNGGYFKQSEQFSDKAARTILPLLGKPLPFYKRFYFKDQGMSSHDIESIYQKRLSLEKTG